MIFLKEITILSKVTGNINFGAVWSLGIFIKFIIFADKIDKLL